MARINGHLNLPKHSRVMLCEEGIQPRVLPVDGQRILCEVVGSDREEIAFRRELIGNQNGCRCLNHDTDCVIAKLHALLLQFFRTLREQLLALSELPHRNNHREHDAEVAVGRCTEQCSQLGLKEVLPGQANADCAHTHGRILLLRHVHVLNLLVRTDVAGADDDLLRRKRLDREAISIKLLLLTRIVSRIEVDKLRAEEAHAPRIVLLYKTDVGGAADVRIDLNGLAVYGRIALSL